MSAIFKTVTIGCLLLTTLSLGCVDPALRRGQNALGQGQYTLAIQHLADARRHDPGSESATRDLASAYRALAAEQADAGQCAAAANTLEHAEALSAPNLSTIQVLFQCVTVMGAAAPVRERVARKLIELGDQRTVVLRTIVRALYEQDRTVDAAEFSRIAFRKHALETIDIQRAADTFTDLGRPKEAIPFLQTLLRRAPSDPLIRLRLAHLYSETDAVERARMIYFRLARDFPKNPVIFLRIAQFKARIHDERGAAEALNRANQLRGLTPNAPRQLRPLLKSRR
ncbi:MAG: tetratricopeptide repeat protein [Myxococcota bacterium]|nr:tetratricopeptide repeat protein [Myxococcota bacterium]